MKYALVDEHFEQSITDPQVREKALVLGDHPDLPGHWIVDGFTNDFLFDLGELIGPYRAVAPSGMGDFIGEAARLGYWLAFFEDPTSILEEYSYLNAEPEVEVQSTFPNTIKGMLPYQVQGYNMLKNLDYGVARWDTGPQPLTAQLLTPDGWISMADATLGLEIIGSDGQPYFVTGVFPQGEAEVYRLTFKDGSQADSTLDHLWGFYNHVGTYQIRPLRDYLAYGLKHRRGDNRWFVDRVAPINFAAQELPLDPYLLGVLLGDGSLTGSVPQVYSHHGEILPHIKPMLPSSMRISQYGDKHFALVADSAPHPNPVKQTLRDLGLWGHTAADKFVPRGYMIASREQRLALLQGLLDTDGSAEIQSARFYSISRRLAEDVTALARSLGGRAVMTTRRARLNHRIGDTWHDTQVGYTVTLSLPQDFDYFRLPRKKVRSRPPIGPNALISVERLGVQAVQCIAVDAPDHRYITNDYVLTHNTGKTVGAAALVKYHQMQKDYDYCFFVVKAHNKANTARKLLNHVGLEAHVVKGLKSQRVRTYLRATEGPYSSRMRILILNYEQFKNDFVIWEEIMKRRGKEEEMVKRITGLTEWGEAFFPNKDLLIVWDEMPTKLKTRTTQLYKSICYCLYRTDPPQVNRERLRPKSLRSYMLSATPIENSPEDWFNCIRLMDGGRTYGTVSVFNSEYVASWNSYDPDKPETFHNLEKMRLKAAFFVHQVDKTDPDIASVFPKAVEEVVYIDWDERNQKLYEGIQKFAKDLAASEEFQDLPVFSLLGALQMVCDAPAMVGDSAAEREAYEAALEAGEKPDPKGSSVALTLIEQFGKGKFINTHHPKMEKLKEILLERHPDSQVAIYTRWNQALMPYLEEELRRWDVSFVRYDGTPNQKQRAQDAFQAGKAKVFLSSDAGSDSIDLDAGNVVIDYDLPWKWTTLTQRHNRVHRATSTHETVYYYSLLMADSVEQRVLQVIEKKRGYHQELFDAAGGDYSASARLTKDDLLYLLTGR